MRGSSRYERLLWVIAWLIAVVGLGSGCAHTEGRESLVAAGGIGHAEYRGSSEPTADAAASPLAPHAPSAAPAMLDTRRRIRAPRLYGRASLEQPSTNPQVETISPPATALPARKVYYEGYLKIAATNPEELLAEASAVATKAGGYVESLVGSRLVVRVPVGSFRAVLEQIIGLGDVLQRRITAQDITEAYQAVELRLKVLEASRKRLMQLLAAARREQEKLSLLAEVKRLTEQIDQLEAQQQALASMAAFSRMTVDAAPRPQRLAGTVPHDLGVFRWIDQLSPFARDVAQVSHRFELPVPEGMVELDQGASLFHSIPWVAQSADGAAVWTSARDNVPAGDRAFWLEAVKRRLTQQYADVRTYDVGSFAVLELRNAGKQAYRYLIALRVRDDTLEVVEIYFPSPKHQQQYEAAVKRVLERV